MEVVRKHALSNNDLETRNDNGIFMTVNAVQLRNKKSWPETYVSHMECTETEENHKNFRI